MLLTAQLDSDDSIAACQQDLATFSTVSANGTHSIHRKYQLRASLRLAVGACFYLEENTGDVRR